MNEGSIAKDTMAVCFATILLVALLLGAWMLRPSPQAPATLETTAGAPVDAPTPFLF